MLESPIEAQHSRGELLKETSVFIWDEAPMANRGVLGCVNDVLRRVTEHYELLFGGKIKLLLGDHRQCCPVIRGGTRRQVVDASIKSSPLWEHIQVRRLTVPIRNATDPAYADFVDAIGNGEGPKVQLWPFINVVYTPGELIDFVFPEIILQDPETSVKRSILAPTNQQVDDYNSIIINRMPGPSKTYLAANRIKEMDETEGLPAEAGAALLDYVAQKTPPGVPAHTLTVRVGAVYRLMRNLAPERGCVKNIRAVIENIGNCLIAVRLIRPENGNRVDDEVTLLPRIPFEVTLHSGHTLVRRQFPLAPAYATTFNSCQGLTLDRVAIDLTSPMVNCIPVSPEYAPVTISGCG